MSAEGTVELRMDHFTEFVRDENPQSQQMMSHPVHIHGLIWKISVRKTWESPPSYNRNMVEPRCKALIFSLECNGEDDDLDWKCNSAGRTFRIVSQKEGTRDINWQNGFYWQNISKENYSKKLATAYFSLSWMDNPLHAFRYNSAGRIGDLHVDLDKGFIKDDTVIFRAHVVPQGVYKTKQHISSISDPANVVLIVGSNRIPVHKTYLSFYSDFFKTMFQSEFKEGREDEIVLEEVEYGEMIELLAVIYPSAAPITGKNFKSILKLADRFIMPAVLERCKNALSISTKINDTQKLQLAQQYNFVDLQLELTLLNELLGGI